MPKPLKHAIFAYYRFLWRSVQSIEEDKVMADLPPVMQLQIDIVVRAKNQPAALLTHHKPCAIFTCKYAC